MLVKELIEYLKTLPETTPIVMSGDSEGNYYSPLAGYAMGKYVEENSWSGQFYDLADYESEITEGYVDEDSGVDALCIWPTN